MPIVKEQTGGQAMCAIIYNRVRQPDLDAQFELQLALEPLQAGAVFLTPGQGGAAVILCQTFQNAARLNKDVAVYQILSHIASQISAIILT